MLGTKLNLLVIGSGGREHAIVWKLVQSPRAGKIYCSPGNAGISALAECVEIAVTDVNTLADFAKRQKIDLTVVGPEAALAAGVVDRFQQEGLKIFGPTQAAAQLETSKAFAKMFCEENKIPQAKFATLTDLGEAKKYLESQNFPLVIKADGLAAGKGVSICQTVEEAIAAVREAMVGEKFGAAGKKIVIEEFLRGEEASFIVLVIGDRAFPLATARDYKRLLDGNRGPNTGGMGTVSPSPLMTAQLEQKIMTQIILPTVRGMKQRGTPFAGFLYAGLMINNGEPKLLEYNVRLGDPEAQVILPRLQTDLLEALEGLPSGGQGGEMRWDPRPTVCVVMAAQGYPEHYETGKVIHGLSAATALSDLMVFHAGTRLESLPSGLPCGSQGGQGGKVVTAGGRVLGVTAWDIDKAYQACSLITWDGFFYRKDIGQ